MRNTRGLFVCAGLIVPSLFGQNAETLQNVHRVFVSLPPGRTALTDLRKELLRQLGKTGVVTLVDQPARADAVLAVDGDIFVKGYISLNPRAGSYAARGEPVRSGFLSLELKGRNSDPLWSYLITPRSGSTHIEQDLSKQAARELSGAIRTANQATQGAAPH